MKIEPERGQLWSMTLQMAKNLLGYQGHPYTRTKGIVKHDRCLNGERICRERRHA